MYNITDVKQLQEQIALYNEMSAYKTLYDIFYPSLFRFSYSILKSKEVAEEIVSDVFIKVWQMRNELNKIDALKVYLYVITKNFSLNYITKNFKTPVTSIEEIEAETLFSMLTPEDELISAELAKKLSQAIRELPSQCRIIFQLVKEDGLKYKEVASILDISVLTVRNQVAIALKKLEAALPSLQYKSVIKAEKFSDS